MTEEEHKTKWCPQARLGSSTSGLGGFNRFVWPANNAASDGVQCIGSACAWWRWIHVSAVKWEGNTALMQYPDPEPTEGYCGPAGKP